VWDLEGQLFASHGSQFAAYSTPLEQQPLHQSAAHYSVSLTSVMLASLRPLSAADCFHPRILWETSYRAAKCTALYSLPSQSAGIINNTSDFNTSAILPVHTTLPHADTDYFTSLQHQRSNISAYTSAQQHLPLPHRETILKKGVPTSKRRKVKSGNSTTIAATNTKDCKHQPDAVKRSELRAHNKPTHYKSNYKPLQIFKPQTIKPSVVLLRT